MKGMVPAVEFAVWIESRACTVSSSFNSAALTLFWAARISSLDGMRREGPVSSVTPPKKKIKKGAQGQSQIVHLLDETAENHEELSKV